MADSTLALFLLFFMQEGIDEYQKFLYRKNSKHKQRRSVRQEKLILNVFLKINFKKKRKY